MTHKINLPEVSDVTTKAGTPFGRAIQVKLLGEYRALWHYNKLICSYIGPKDELYLDADHWKYSVTTVTVRNTFTGLTSKETQEGIDNGTIKFMREGRILGV